ncbi:unnamed protein product [Clonostachys solani]|uniref:Uncharacterized protein n=1 Tax=Clonostachys solani TaxID=160281 RepID=A0A9N9W7K6_9HYPO|nr:unnamed protein product [Clonostachys solani]
MSGIEVAGLAVGAFPILFEAFKEFRKAAKPLKLWWRFEVEFDNFLAAVQREQIAYSQNLEILIDALDLSEHEKTTLQNVPESNVWYEPRVQSALRRRLQNRHYPWFMEQLRDTNVAVEKLLGLLPIGKAYLVDSKSIEAEMFRLKRSFSREKDDLLGIVRDRNEAIFHFLNRDSMVNHAKTQPLEQIENPRFLSLQTQARDIYVCLRQHWTCTCPEMHPCGITVSRNHINGNPLELSFIFSGEDTPILKVQFDEVQLPTIKISEPEDEDIANLRSQLTIRRHKARIISDKGTKGILSSIGLLALDSEARRSSSFQDRTLERRTSLLERGRSFLRSSRYKSIDADIHEPTPAIPEKRRISAPSFKAHDAESFPKVRFLCDDSTPSFLKPANPMGDLCSMLKTPSVNDLPGFWNAGQDKRILLTMGPYNQAEGRKDQLTSLEEFLLSTARRDHRVEQALGVLVTILSLGPLPLVPMGWDKSKIFLRSSQIKIAEPYLSHSSLKLAVNSESHPRRPDEVAKTYMFAIGVLLLELLFRETLERQPFRTQFLGPTGEPNEYTDFCTAMQWQKKVMEECGTGLADAIHRCIVCSFDSPLDLSSPSFVNSVWQGVGRPVEEFLKAWDPAV